MKSIEINGEPYQCGKLDAYQQFHCSRRLAPILASTGISFAMLSRGARLTQEDLDVALGPASVVLSAMPQEDVDYILSATLSLVQRRQGDSWAAVNAAGGPRLMFADMDMGVMLKLVMCVLGESLGDFLKGLGGPTT